MTPWDLYDIADFVKARGQTLASRYELHKQKRFVKREEKKARAEQKRAEQEQKQQKKNVWPSLKWISKQAKFWLIQPMLTRPQQSLTKCPNLQTQSLKSCLMTKELWRMMINKPLIYLSKKNKLTNLGRWFYGKNSPALHLANDWFVCTRQAQNQSKEKSIVRHNIKVLEDTFTSFGIDVKVERAEIGPFGKPSTKLNQPLVCVSTAFPIWQMI